MQVPEHLLQYYFYVKLSWCLIKVIDIFSLLDYSFLSRTSVVLSFLKEKAVLLYSYFLFRKFWLKDSTFCHSMILKIYSCWTWCIKYFIFLMFVKSFLIFTNYFLYSIMWVTIILSQLRCLHEIVVPKLGNLVEFKICHMLRWLRIFFQMNFTSIPLF